jgi:hypothetical protein
MQATFREGKEILTKNLIRAGMFNEERC